MNKGFFVVFLGVILGAMALIFVNQPPNPAVVSVSTGQAGGMVSAPAGGGAAAGPGTETTTVATARQPASVKPETPKPETPRVAPVKPETPVTPETPKPEAPRIAPEKPEAPKPEAAVPATPKPEIATPDVAAPEAPRAETPAPGTSKPEAPQAGAPKPATTVMTPVTAVPETRRNPGGVQAKKSVTLVNIGLHFKGGGMALRLEADAPFSYKTFALLSPDRYVVDLVGTWDKVRAPVVPSNNMIKGARAGTQPGGPRLVLDMQRAPKKHNVTWLSPTVLEIVIE